MKTAVDSSVLLDVLGADTRFGDWSREALRTAYNAGALAVMAPPPMPAGAPSPGSDRGDDHRGGRDDDPDGRRAPIRDGWRVHGAPAQEHRDEGESDHVSHGGTSCVRLGTLSPIRRTAPGPIYAAV
jgi:hypothetical protein